MSSAVRQDFNEQVIAEFRANNGNVGGLFEGERILLLTTTGARSGRPHTTPLGFLNGADDQMIVIASAGGGPKNPAWYHNLRANPEVTVESGAFTLTAQARVLAGEERERVFARSVEADPSWQQYQDRAGRTLPVVVLQVVDGRPNNPTGGWGDGLVAIHDGFRRELAIVRAEVARAGTSLGAQLRINCLAVCQGLHFHHQSEDQGMFPALDEANPELAPTMERLRQEHVAIARLIDELQAVVQGDSDEHVDLLGTVDRLISELEAHLDYEEEHLVPVLNAAAPG